MRTSVAEKPFSSKKWVPYDLIIEYLRDVFLYHKENDGYICIRSGPNGHAAQSWLDINNLDNLKIELFRHDYRDAFFTFSTYKKGKNPKRTIDNIQNIYAFSIDVDYKMENTTPLHVFEYIMDNVSLPTPNYIEYGHRLRMIYLFEEPLRLYKNQKESLLNGFNFLQKCFCKKINHALSLSGDSFGAEANPASSFFRIPGSVNRKDGSTIQIMHITNERWTMQELFEEWISKDLKDDSGNKDEWYPIWKNKQHNSASIIGFSSYTLWERRMKVLEELRKMDNPHRKRMCFYYGAGITQIYGMLSPEEWLEKLSDFNNGFLNPLPKHILKRVFQWQSQTQKRYKFTDDTIAENLEIDKELFSSYSRKERDFIRYQNKRKNQIALEKTKEQQVKKRRSAVLSMLSFGNTISEIAKTLRVSVSTIKRDIIILKQMKNKLKLISLKERNNILKNLFMERRKVNLGCHASNTYRPQEAFGIRFLHPQTYDSCSEENTKYLFDEIRNKIKKILEYTVGEIYTMNKAYTIISKGIIKNTS